MGRWAIDRPHHRVPRDKVPVEKRQSSGDKKTRTLLHAAPTFIVAFRKEAARQRRPRVFLDYVSRSLKSRFDRPALCRQQGGQVLAARERTRLGLGIVGGDDLALPDLAAAVELAGAHHPAERGARIVRTVRRGAEKSRGTRQWTKHRYAAIICCQRRPRCTPLRSFGGASISRARSARLPVCRPVPQTAASHPPRTRPAPHRRERRSPCCRTRRRRR